ncbi:MAG TPA: DEAD/DEAH box helicase [Chloroflexia bacterium]|nr:DEAD/DEAH box helicase [Chloroflexia bacterium]
MLIEHDTVTAEKPLVSFLRQNLRQLASVFSADAHQLHDRLRDKLASLRFSLPPDSPLQPFTLVGGQALPGLSLNSLNQYLENYGLPPARFLAQPPHAFDSALVSIGPEAGGSGYLFFWDTALPGEDIYYLLAHAWGHLALGHLRAGDEYSHWDVLSDLQRPAGPARRWDLAVQKLFPYWFEPLEQAGKEDETGIEPVKWQFPDFEEAFWRFDSNALDNSALSALAAAQRYTGQMVQVDFDIARDAALFPHQLRGAVELAVRLQRLGVALLADSVGLGKTRTTATLIRLLRQNNIIGQAAVLTPQKLEHNWRAEFKQLKLRVGEPGDPLADVVVVNKDKFKRMEPIKARAQVRNCDLLIIEEAHQDLRNTSNKFHRNLREAAIGKYGLLVTATPWNNRRGDIFAMLHPFATNALGRERPASAWECFSKSIKDGQSDFEKYDEIFRQIYSLTALQRTRRQLSASGDNAQVFYAPRRPYLLNVPYTEEQKVAFATLLDKIQQLRLPQVNFMRYLTSDESEVYLSGFQRFGLLKRAESSMYAFRNSLDALAVKAESLLRDLHQVKESNDGMAEYLYKRFNLEKPEESENATHEVTAEPPKARYTNERARKLIEQAAEHGQLIILHSTLIRDCAHDLQLIRQIQKEFHDLFNHDPKLEQVLVQVKQAIAAGHKVLCISQYADTAFAVYRHLVRQPILLQKGVGLVVGGAGKSYDAVQINQQPATREEVLRRFAPTSWAANASTGNKDGNNRLPLNIDILVGSDTLSVGQNLQDARVLINLDLCWNPMQHEQRIGRIDRPRHASDSAPLDIYYLLNLELIESELKLQSTIEKRLTATYQDTEFDDEILPGYFEMIEQFRRLRQEHAPDQLMLAEADTVLQDIAERSARPPQVSLPNNEQERGALLQLQQWASQQSELLESADLNRLLVTSGKISLYDHNQALRSDLPQMELLAELEFRPVDAAEHPAGQPVYRHCYLSLKAEPPASTEWQIELDTERLTPLVSGLLSEPLDKPLTQPQLAQLQALLLRLEEYGKEELESQQTNLRRTLSRLRKGGRQADDEELLKAQTIQIRLINLKCLVL